jgi:PPOX class probable F420-dependent enzyme
VPPPAVEAKVRSFLERARRAHLATASAAGEPHVVPICFALLDEDTVVFAIDDKPKNRSRPLKRLRNLAENERFALVVDVWDEDWTKLAYVLLHGSGGLLPPGGRRARATEALRARYPQYVAMGLDARHEVVELRVERAYTWGAVASP